MTLLLPIRLVSPLKRLFKNIFNLVWLRDAQNFIEEKDEQSLKDG